MAEKTPVIIYLDAEAENTFTIKPFAAGLATRSIENPDATNTASCTGNPCGSDVDADID